MPTSLVIRTQEKPSLSPGLALWLVATGDGLGTRDLLSWNKASASEVCLIVEYTEV